MLALAGTAPLAHAQVAHPDDPKACVGIETASQRLACYDHAFGRAALVPGKDQSAQDDNRKARHHSQGVFARDAGVQTQPEPDVTGKVHRLSLLDSRWELAPNTKLGTFNVRGYKPVYLMPAFYTTNVNNRPHSPTHSVDQSLHYDKTEAKFQLSLKTKLWQGIFGHHGDLWFGYTQTSRWQVYDSRISRPFRETDYEPEAMLVFNTHYNVLGWEGRLLGIGINHQSNGRSDPLSRSWNRVIADIGFERGNWTVMIRPWWRINETVSKDDNPDIEDYMGRGEVQIVHEVNDNEFSLTARHSFRSGDRSHGSLRFSWAFPITDKLRGYMQVFNGYGESLIDYNHKATYVGVGVSLLGWY
ncbi:phospholipase A [Oleiagrimonas sp. C23AA]|nr:phospholipase A [Oleiagrimonas sp. C23AA]